MAPRASRRMHHGSLWRKEARPDLDHAAIAWIWFGWASATLLALVAIYLYRDCQLLHTVLKHETIRLNQLSRTLGILRTV